MICCRSVSHICNRSHARRVNSGKITISWGTPIWCSQSMANSSPNGTTFGHKKLETLCWQWHTYKPGVFISPGLESVRGPDGQTDGRTDKIAIASTRLALRCVRPLSVKALICKKIPEISTFQYHHFRIQANFDFERHLAEKSTWRHFRLQNNVQHSKYYLRFK